MKLFPHREYRKETDPELVKAAEAAYREGRPEHNTRHSRLARAVAADSQPRGGGTAASTA